LNQYEPALVGMEIKCNAHKNGDQLTFHAFVVGEENETYIKTVFNSSDVGYWKPRVQEKVSSFFCEHCILMESSKDRALFEQDLFNARKNISLIPKSVELCFDDGSSIPLDIDTDFYKAILSHAEIFFLKDRVVDMDICKDLFCYSYTEEEVKQMKVMAELKREEDRRRHFEHLNWYNGILNQD